MFFVCKPLSNLICFYADNVEFQIYSLYLPFWTSFLNVMQEKSFGNVFLAVKALRVDYIYKQDEYHLIDFLKLFKNVKRITFGFDIRFGISGDGISDGTLKLLSKTSLEIFIVEGWGFMVEEKENQKSLVCKHSFSSLGLEILPFTLTELIIPFWKKPLGKLDNFRFLLRRKLKKVNLDGTVISDKDLFHFPKCIVDLSIKGCNDISSEGFKTLFKDSVIEKLDAGKSSICNISLSFLPKTLSELNVSICKGISDDGIKHLKKTNIKILNISLCFNITKEGFSYLPEFVEELYSSGITSDECMKELSKLKIKKLFCGEWKHSVRIRISSRGLEFLPHTLKVLDLSCNSIVRNFDYIQNFNSIEELNLSNTYLSNKGLMESLSKFKELKKLNLCGCDIANELLEMIPTTLKELYIFELRNIYIYHDMYKRVNFESLTKFKELESLSIGFTNSGSRKLTMGLEGLNDRDLEFIPQNVSWLKISGKNLSDEGFKKLQCIENLKYLFLLDCRNVTNKGVFYIIKKSEYLKEFC